MTYTQTYEIFSKLFQNQLTKEEAKELLISLYQKGESKEEIAAAAKVMRENSIAVKVDPSIQDKLIDNCGTGGDKSGSFNISTCTSILLASAGCFVAKHGNRSITSKAGSTDVLEALGVNLDISIQNLPHMIQETNWMFMFAAHHHPCMKHIMPIRKSIAHRTIFNILGPLCNPANVQKQLIGVFSPDFLTQMIGALDLLGSKNAMTVSSKDGLDEVSISDITYYQELKDGVIKEGEINPQDYGFKLARLNQIKGGDAKENASIVQDILSNKEKGAKRDIVLLNSAIALNIDGKARDIKEGIQIATQAIESGKSIQTLKNIIEISNIL